MAINIRLATTDDVQHLADVERSASRAFHIFPDYIPHGRTVPSELLISMATSQKLWVATVQDRIVGFAGCREMDGILYLHEISVAFEHQKQGIGRRLMGIVIDEAMHANYPAIGLTTRRDAAWNKPFYKKLGFIEVENAQEWPDLFAQLQKEIDSGMLASVRCAMIRKL